MLNIPPFCGYNGITAPHVLVHKTEIATFPIYGYARYLIIKYSRFLLQLLAPAGALYDMVRYYR